jgi:hypothetical protein
MKKWNFPEMIVLVPIEGFLQHNSIISEVSHN